MKNKELWHKLLDSHLPYPFDTDLNPVPMSLDMLFYNLLKGKDYLVPFYIDFLKNDYPSLVGLEDFLSTITYLHDKSPNLAAPPYLQRLKQILKEGKSLSKSIYKDHIHNYLRSCHPNINPVEAAKGYKSNKKFNDFLSTGKAQYD